MEKFDFGETCLNNGSLAKHMDPGRLSFEDVAERSSQAL